LSDIDNQWLILIGCFQKTNLEIERIISFSTLFQRMDFINVCEEGRLDRVIELVNNGVDIHADEDYGFRIACLYGHLDIIKYLMEQEDKPNIHVDDEYGFQLICQNRHLEVFKCLMEYDNKPNNHVYKEYGFQWACHNGHLEVIKYLMSLDNKPNIHTDEDYGFRIACLHGQLEVIKYLMKQDDKPNIHVINEEGFRCACFNGHLEVIKYLMSLDDKSNIHAVDEGFRSACKNEHNEVAEYLSTICDEYELVIENGKLISWKVNKNWTKELIGKEREIGVCQICDEERLLYGMKCDETHEMCKECYDKIRNMGENKCPYCREEMV
jgi:hypothetical protein